MDAIADIFQQHGRKLATSVGVIAVIIMALSVAQTVLFVIDNADDSVAVSPRPANRVSVDRPGDNINLAALNLFGVLEVGEARVIEAPQTNLNLELQGVFTADKPDESSAIVAERNRSGELYRIGDRLPGNAVLDSVHDDHILIRRGGRLEKLAFPEVSLSQQFDSGFDDTDDSSALSPSTSSRLQDLRERIAARRAETSAPDEPEQSAIQLREYMTEYRERLDEDPEAALAEIGFEPVEPGEAAGYRIADDSADQYLRQAGLQQGDIVLSVNGSPVGDMSGNQALIDQALAEGRARVEVQRGDRKFFLTVPIP